MRVLNSGAPTLPTSSERDMLAYLQGYLGSPGEAGHALGPVPLEQLAEQIGAYLVSSRPAFVRQQSELARVARLTDAARAVAAAVRGEGAD